MIKGVYTKHVIAIVSIYMLLLSSFIVMVLYTNNVEDAKNSLLVNTVVEIPEGKKLIPETAIQGIDDVKEINLEYNVKIIGTQFNNDQINVECSNIKIGNNSEHSDLLKINVEKTLSDVKNEVIVKIIITLDEPDDYSTYLKIANQNITMDIIFTAYRYIEL